VVVFDSLPADVKGFSRAEELTGKLRFQDVDEKLMHSVIENDKEKIDDGKLISGLINQGFSSFTPDMMFENLAKDYSLSQHLYGERLIRLVSGYDPNYLKKNIPIPEFKREFRQRMREQFDRLLQEGLVNRQGELTNKAFELASLVLYVEELDRLVAKGFAGNKASKRMSVYGDKGNVREYRKGDRYRNIAIRQSIKTAARRMHQAVTEADLRVFDRFDKGSIQVIYAIDASGSMRGEKIAMAKRAGIALAYTAINQKDRVGLVVFGSDIREAIQPTLDFDLLVKSIAVIHAAKETNINLTIKKAAELFSREQITKHLIILTDCLPTIGKEPEKETLEAVGNAGAMGITTSLVGIKLDEAGKRLAEQIVQLGKGRLYIAQNLKELDTIVIRDYYSI
jgi:Mg-chelatase subunit ChlD